MNEKELEEWARVLDEAEVPQTDRMIIYDGAYFYIDRHRETSRLSWSEINDPSHW